VFFRWRGNDRSITSFLLFFAGILVLLRVVPLCLRTLLPFSKEVQAVWFGRRMLSKQYDSYQWRKLFWIGLGLTGYTILFGDIRTTHGVLALVCLLGGGAGLWVWHRLGIDKQTTVA
jgi:hypothetical protein